MNRTTLRQVQGKRLVLVLSEPVPVFGTINHGVVESGGEQYLCISVEACDMQLRSEQVMAYLPAPEEEDAPF